MKELTEHLREIFRDEDGRYGYADAFLNGFIAAQIKALREAAGMSQERLAEAIGTKQSGISRLENVNYSSWKVDTLRKLARAFGVRLRISFEEFGSLIPEVEGFGVDSLKRRQFEQDPVFAVERGTGAITYPDGASSANYQSINCPSIGGVDAGRQLEPAPSTGGRGPVGRSPRAKAARYRHESFSKRRTA